MKNYKKHLYSEYATTFKNAGKYIDLAKANKFWPIFKYCMRGWLPNDKKSKIIDLGCGDGTIMHLLKKKCNFSEIYGVDISPNQVALAKQHMSNVEQGDALEYLRKTNHKFDLILAIDIIEHLNKGEALELIELCYKKLNNGGRVVFQTPNAASPFFGVVRYGDFTHELGFTSNLLSQLLVRAGFKNIVSRESGPIPFGYSFFSSLRYLIWQFIRIIYSVISTIETGGSGNKIFTRVFLQSGNK